MRVPVLYSKQHILNALNDNMGLKKKVKKLEKQLQDVKQDKQRGNNIMCNELKGMNLIESCEIDASIAVGHDQLWFGNYKPELMTKEQLDKMKKWGWFEDEDAWSTFI